MVPHTHVSVGHCEPSDWETHRFGLPDRLLARLRSRVFWVTGAGTGFGRAVATALALLGARVVLTGRRAAKLDETIAEAGRFGAPRERFEIFPLDLTDASAMEAAPSALRRGNVSGLVHCAAVPQPRESEASLLATDSLRRLLLVNVEAAWLACRAAITAAADRGEVRVVLFSSEAAWHFTPGFGPYNISKAALNSLGGSFAAEARSTYPACDVQINVLNPGEARSEMNQGSTRSPYTAVPMTLALLGQPKGGPNGCYFHADGRHLTFGSALAWPAPLLPADSDAPPRLIRTLSGYNIVCYQGVFFGLPQGLGHIQLETHPVLPASVVRGVSLEEVETRVLAQINRRENQPVGHGGTRPCHDN